MIDPEILAEGVSAQTVARLKQDLSFAYPHGAAAKTPSKQTATQLKGRIKDQEAVENTKQSYTVRKFRKPTFIQQEHSGADYGTAHHTLMQYIRYKACNDAASVRDEIQRLVAQGLLTVEQAHLINCDQIAAFFATELGRRLCGEDMVLREFKFSILDNGANYVPGMEGEQVLLQGVVDCALIEPDGITIIDFKTNKVTEETLMQTALQYREQVLIYAEALERIYQKPVKSAQLYFFRLNRFVTVE